MKTGEAIRAGDAHVRVSLGLAVRGTWIASSLALLAMTKALRIIGTRRRTLSKSCLLKPVEAIRAGDAHAGLSPDLAARGHGLLRRCASRNGEVAPCHCELGEAG
jgi:hypothetical protein